MENTTTGSAVEPHSITYWESRQINIGDYENVSFGATSIVKFVPINRQETRAEISQAEITHQYPNMTDSEAMDTARLKVRQILDSREREIRLKSNSNGSTSFDTMKKGVDFGVISPKDAGLASVEDTNKRDDFDDDDDEFETPKKKPAPALKGRPKASPPPAEPAKKKFSMRTSTTKSGLFASGERATKLADKMTANIPDKYRFNPDEELDI